MRWVGPGITELGRCCPIFKCFNTGAEAAWSRLVRHRCGLRHPRCEGRNSPRALLSAAGGALLVRTAHYWLRELAAAISFKKTGSFQTDRKSVSVVIWAAKDGSFRRAERRSASPRGLSLATNAAEANWYSVSPSCAPPRMHLLPEERPQSCQRERATLRAPLDPTPHPARA